MGLVTIIYTLRFETSPFFASYDSQGYGGGIRPRLHTGDIHCHFGKNLSPTFLLYDMDRIENNASNNSSLPQEHVCEAVV
jgi:hypothetical protein